jgi:YD repeat-containing protein
VTLDYSASNETTCVAGAVFCTSEKYTIVAHDAAPGLAQNFYVSYRVDRWNLDARGRVAGPTLYVSFQNPFGNVGTSSSASTGRATRTNYDPLGNTTTTSANAGDSVDTAPWSGAAGLGTNSRIVRRSVAPTGEFIEPGGTERWTASLTFRIVEVPAGR